MARILIAFDDSVLDPDPTWTAIDQVQEVGGETVALVAGYEISRGRPDQFARTGTGTARVFLNDRTGLFDRNNTGSPYFGKLDGKQIRLQLWNPVRSEWVPQFTGQIDDYQTVLNPATQDGVSVVADVVIECVDMFDYLAGYEVMPGLHGDTPPPGSEGTVWFDPDDVDGRIEQLLAIAEIHPDRSVVFTGNINVIGTPYDAGDSILVALRDACDAELPSVANMYTDKLGRYHFHGRGSRFDPDGVFAGATPGSWDFHRVKAGDGAAILGDPDRAQIRELAYHSPRGEIINSAICWPRHLPVAAKEDQVFTDTASKDAYGYHALSPMGDLIIAFGTTTGNTAKVECQKYAEMFVTNLAEPKTRIQRLVFKSIHLTDARAEKTWEFLTDIDISDVVELAVGYPGGAGIDEAYFVEGIEMNVTPANPGYDLVVLALDVSPLSDYADDVGLWP